MTSSEIETLFRKTVRRDANVRNAYLLVHSDTHDLHIGLSEGMTDGHPASPRQPIYMASVGKLFTSTIIGILKDQQKLSFDDPIGTYLDDDLMNGLHVFKKNDYSDQIQIRHLLNQSSGLPDNFFPLLDRLLKEPEFNITPRKAVEWTKEIQKPVAPPGKKAHYTDTNYQLLGLIVEEITGQPFHHALHDMIFDPLGMTHAFMLQTSDPAEKSTLPIADFYIDNTRLNDVDGFANIDYAGGGVVAPLDELLIFMKAFANHQLISRDTFDQMMEDKMRFLPTFDYGYGIWQVKPIPVLLSAKYKCCGVIGATGAFMFYHPELDTYIIGNFNHTSYQKKCIRFLFKVINSLHS